MYRKKHSPLTCSVCALLMFLLAVPFYGQETVDSDALQYNLAVNAIVVPVFALDTGGNPVHDLKAEELQLEVNKEPAEILLFKRYEFSDEKTVTITTKEGKKETLPVQRVNRVIFIILDTMFNSLTGFRRGKEIASRLVRESLDSDEFVILENHNVGGLKYLAGPDNDKKKLLKAIKAIKAPPDKWNPHLYSNKLLPNNINMDLVSDGRISGISDQWNSVRKLSNDSEKYRYRHQIKYFTRLLSQFKFALKTIDKPKLVFLVSEGVATGAFKAAARSMTTYDPNRHDNAYSESAFRKGRVDEPGYGMHSVFNKEDKMRDASYGKKVYSAFLLNYLLDIVASINKGGSVLYTINPRRSNDTNEDDTVGEMSLRTLADEGGGKYFAGSVPAKVVEKIKKTTAAYYELFYAPTVQMGGNMTIRVRCKRKGVKIHTLHHTERNKPYRLMERVQKKIFALNVVTGGTWSRMVGKVARVKYKRASAPGKERRIAVSIPKNLRSKPLDLFQITMDPKTQHTDMVLKTLENTAKAEYQYTPVKGKLHYFAIIEPESSVCMYNQLK